MKNLLYPMEIDQIEKYTKNIIPEIEQRLVGNCSNKEKVALYSVYRETLKKIAPYDFVSFNKFLEFEEDWHHEQKKFYGHRATALKDLFEALNDMEIYDKYDIVIITMPPRIGKTTTGIRYLSWIAGRHPEHSQLATSYADNVTMSFYMGVMDIVASPEFRECFPESVLVNQNAKREEIWLRRNRRYPTLTFVPIDGSMTGRCEAEDILYCDDLVSGLEEALNQNRLNKLWEKYTVNVRQRKKKNCKEIHIATPWSVHDVITRVKNANSDNPRCKIIKLSCYDENGESNFDYIGGFDTKYYKSLEKDMDKISFDALYRQEPVEREGLLYDEMDFQYFKELPKQEPDTIVAICDSKNLGTDSVACPIAYIYDNEAYIVDVVFNSGLPDITKPLVAKKLIENNVKDFSIELNNGGNYFGEDVKKMVSEYLPNIRFSMFFTTGKKDIRIVTYSDFVKKNFRFWHKTRYAPSSEYGKFMSELFRYTQTGKNLHDDAADSIAMLASKIDRMATKKIKILDRRNIGL